MTPDLSLLRPERAAYATIHGFLYQTCLGVLRWLDLKSEEEVLLCEGDEDLDQRLLGGGGVSEQVKVSSDGLGLSDRAVRESLRNFLVSYVALREQGESRRFRFTTTAPARRARGFDLLAAWDKGERGPEVIEGARRLLTKRDRDEKEERQAEVEKALSWLDAAADGWPDFLGAVEWRFESPALESVRWQIGERLAKREDARLLPAEDATDRLVAAVFKASIQKKPEDRVLTRQSLSDLLEEMREGLGRWAQSPEGRRLRAVFDEVREIRRLLDDGTLPLPESPSPGKRLTAAYEVIPFDEGGRREDLVFLEEWCNSEPRRSVLLLTGEGGSGKTRLLVEWCRRLRHQRWHAGFLLKDRGIVELDPLLDGAAPRLIVIDYAEARPLVVEGLLEKIARERDRHDPKVRLVCLARLSGDWWKGLRRKGDAVEDLLLASPEPRALSPLVSQPAEREHAFRVAAHAFAEHLGRHVPDDLVVPDLSGRDFERALYLHMAALAALDGERIESAQDALERTLEHERRFWRYRIEDLKTDVPRANALERAVESAMAALTLVQGVARENRARELLQRTQPPPGLPADLFESLFDLLKDLYGGAEGRRLLDPLQPSLLGEQLVEERLGRDDRWLSQVLLGASPDEKMDVLTVLVRLAQRKPAARRWLEGALRNHLKDLWHAAILVTATAGDPLGETLAESLRADPSADIAACVMDFCDEKEFRASIHLWKAALVATEKTLEAARTRGDRSQRGQKELIRILNNQGYWLSELGRRREALQPAEEAVAICRRLAGQEPDVFLPDLAMSLNNLGSRRGDLGQREEALRDVREASDLYRQLAGKRPDEFLSDLAASLNNLGKMLSELNRQEEALQATGEAIEIRRQLGARQRPDLPGLATSLNNQGRILSALGRRKEALKATKEAIEIRRRLARQRPDVFQPDLATSLNNLSRLLGELKRREEALQTAQEVADIYRWLAVQRPEDFLSAFAGSLINLGKNFLDLRRPEEALRATDEAVVICRKLAEETPDALPGLATSLVNKGIVLQALRRHEEALQVTEEASDLYRQLVRHRSDDFLPGFATSLNNKGTMLNSLGRKAEALHAKEDAIRALAPFFVRDPRAFAPRMSMFLKAYRRLLAELGQQPDNELLGPIDALLKDRSAE